jgi:peptidoglycan/xylan/chitin deacetylase (PgdA/CDA1 family)
MHRAAQYRCFIALLFTIFLAQTASAKPYRALLVVGNWADPARVIVDSAKDDFQPVAAVLKAWSLPFDIARVASDEIDRAKLFDASGKPRYGVIVWTADRDPESAGTSGVESAVQAGTTLLVVNSRFLDPTLEQLLGLKFREYYASFEPVRSKQPHFITRALAAQKMDPLHVSWEFERRFAVERLDAETLLAQGEHPVLTVKRHGGAGSALWLGTPSLAWLRDRPYWRTLFFRSLVWALGCLVLPDIDYERRIVLIFDDWGSSEKAFHNLWHYPSLSERDIRERLFEPLRRHRATAVANVVAAFVDRESRKIVSPWKQNFVDPFGTRQDYTETKRGLQAGIQEGIIEIQNHGWTHMLPDLDSAPGPWWTANLRGEGSVSEWYVEFRDDRRQAEIASADQLKMLIRAREQLTGDFGSVPVSFMPPGGAWSASRENHTPRAAAQAGFGLFDAGGQCFFLEPAFVLHMKGISTEFGPAFDRPPLRPQDWTPHPLGPVFITAHDRDLAFQPDFIDSIFGLLPAGTTTMKMAEYAAILHTKIDGDGGPGGELTFAMDSPACAYFRAHPSKWRIWRSDGEVLAIDVPPGGGTQRIK